MNAGEKRNAYIWYVFVCILCHSEFIWQQGNGFSVAHGHKFNFIFIPSTSTHLDALLPKQSTLCFCPLANLSSREFSSRFSSVFTAFYFCSVFFDSVNTFITPTHFKWTNLFFASLLQEYFISIWQFSEWFDFSFLAWKALNLDK